MTRPLPYRLSIAPGLEAFRPELEYACGFLDACHFLERADGAARVLHYGADAPAGAVAVPAALFPRGVHCAEDGIHPAREALAEIESGRGPAPLLPPVGDGGQAAAGHLAYDALGLIFASLSRLEERDFGDLDRYDRFPHHAALAVRLGRFAQPLADAAARDLAAALRGEARPANRTGYGVYLTHDVDMLRGYHRPHQPLRYALGDALKRGRPGAAWRRLADGYFGGEPWRSMRDIMDLSERRGHQSHFYFMGPSRLSMDSPYVLTMPDLLRRAVAEIAARGHGVGFHPGFATATDGAEWRRQRDGLERVIGRDVREGRHHVLRYAADHTPDIWDGAGMDLDCTLSFPEAVGFRSGSCRPHHAYSLRRRRRLRLIQQSTAIMDFGLFGGKYRDLGVDRALAEADTAVAACREYGGTVTVLYHTTQMRGPVRDFYRALVGEVL